MRDEHSQTPAPKLRPISGLLSLSSSSNKKSLVKFLPRINRKQILEIELDSGFVRSRDISQFCSNVIQYLLYDNEIIPFPYQYFEKAYEKAKKINESESLQEKPGDDDEEDDDFLTENPIKVFANTLKPQVQKMYCQLHESFQYLNLLFEETLSIEGVKCIALAVGASIRFIKDVFILDLSGLNIASHSAQHTKKIQTIVSLSNLVHIFFRKLLEASNAGEVKPTNTQKRKQNSVFVLAQFRGDEESAAVEQFYSAFPMKHSNKQEFMPEVMEKLGSNGTKTTVFKIQQDEFYTKSTEDDFEIFCDDDDEESQLGSQNTTLGKTLDQTEEFVECLTEEDEDELQRALNASHRSESNSSLASSASASSESCDNREGFCEEKPWVELIPHINCIAKM